MWQCISLILGQLGLFFVQIMMVFKVLIKGVDYGLMKNIVKDFNLKDECNSVYGNFQKYLKFYNVFFRILVVDFFVEDVNLVVVIKQNEIVFIFVLILG